VGARLNVKSTSCFVNIVARNVEEFLLKSLH